MLAQVALSMPTAPCPCCRADPGLTLPLAIPAGVTSSVAPLTAVSGSVPVPTVLCVLLGTLLGLALAALAVQAHRARVRRRDPVKATDAGSEAVYEELDYSLMPEYQEVPSRTGGSTVVPGAWGCPTPGRALSAPFCTAGSLSKGSGMKLQEENWDSNKESNPREVPVPTAQPGHSPPDGYDDAAAVPEELLAPHGGDAPEQPHRDTGYDDVDVSTLRTAP
ncbi:antigen WC1.1-like [Cygnus olor]|uniref:antigen WC1.1-like n=1 Tax=Cygnus olor TaxID=8869 RepID=UPI001ADE8CEE|nr:antigen WC1.1-like [Cygnus olor]